MKSLVRSHQRLIFALALGLLFGTALGATLRKETVVVREGTANTPAAMSSVNLMIDYGNGIVKTWNTVSWHEAMSIVNLLETVAGAKGITLLTKDGGDKNITVTTIDGVGNDAGKKQREYYAKRRNPRPSPLIGEARYPAKSGVPRPSRFSRHVHFNLQSRGNSRLAGSCR